MARHAAESNASGIAALSPHYIQPASEGDLLECLIRIADAGTSTPFYYYHIPSLTHMPLNMLSFLENSVERIPTMAGIKYTHEDLVEFAACLDAFGDRLELLFGRDELLLHGLMVGARGAVGSMYNLKPELFQALIDAYDSQDLEKAHALSLESQAFIQTMIDYGVYAGGKSFLTSKGIDCGSVRLPLKPLTPSREKELLEKISG